LGPKEPGSFGENPKEPGSFYGVLFVGFFWQNHWQGHLLLDGKPVPDKKLAAGLR
jgi:hypothetical protein